MTNQTVKITDALAANKTCEPVDVTVLIAARNESANLTRSLRSVRPARRVVLVDSQSEDGSGAIAEQLGAEVVQFQYAGGYPKKRQWALDTLDITSPWVLLLDADEEVTPELWNEIRQAVSAPDGHAAYLITKGFHFLGRRFRFGGFSHSAVLLFRTGCVRFEQFDDAAANHDLDMEVHERLIVDGTVGRLKSPLIHEDFKGLQAYIDRHNHYSSWEASVRMQQLNAAPNEIDKIKATLFGDAQQRRRYLKRIAIRIPAEPLLWFLYHYVVRLGFLEGRRGLIASRIRANYIADVRAKIFEARLDQNCLNRSSKPSSSASRTTATSVDRNR